MNRLVSRASTVSGVTTTGYFIYDGDNMVLQLASTGAVTNRVLFGPAVDQVLAEDDASGTVTWALGDNQNTVRDLVQHNTTTGVTSEVDHRTYSAFGQPLSTPAVDFLFGYTGKYYDSATGLQWNLNRWYNPQLQRWMTQDPSGLGPDSNPYRYCGNGPTDGIDPNGEGVRFANGTSKENQQQFWQALVDLFSNGGNVGQELVIALLYGANIKTVIIDPNQDPQSTVHQRHQNSDICLNSSPTFLPPATNNAPSSELQGLFNQDKNGTWTPGPHAGTIVLAHELGHGLVGLSDPQGASKGGNVSIVENPIRRALRCPLRSTYNSTPVPGLNDVSANESKLWQQFVAIWITSNGSSGEGGLPAFPATNLAAILAYLQAKANGKNPKLPPREIPVLPPNNDSE